jgi:hypothetical protein
VVSDLLGEHTTFERHYRVSDLARLWGLGRDTVRKLVKDDPGVIKIRIARYCTLHLDFGCKLLILFWR